MNYVFISPNFPVRYLKFAESLKARGINVLGIGDSPYNDLHPRLKDALTEYYWVGDMNNYDWMKAAVGYFEGKYGHIDYIESNNEWWLTTDARLREDFGVTTGFHPADMSAIKAKSAMKEKFRAAGAKTMRYELIRSHDDLPRALEFAKKVGYPVFVKPDIGVGSSASYKIKTEEELTSFLSTDLPETYIMEEYITGAIFSYDGICDSNSEVVFACADFFPSDDAPLVNDDIDYCYVNCPFELPFPMIDSKKFNALGKRVIKSFGIKQRYFHIEFFCLLEDKPGFAKKGEVVALECNMRPPGGYSPDLINFGSSVSSYEIYGDVIAYDENHQDMKKEKFYCVAPARKDRFNYIHSENEILERYWDHICMHGRYPHHLALCMGDSFFFAKFKTLEEVFKFDAFVRDKDPEHPENAPKRNPKDF